LFKDFTWQAFLMGLIASVVGFASSFAVVVSGLIAVGASPEQASSGLMAGAIAMGVASIVLGMMTKMPIAAAWSTPGAALMVTTGAVDGGFEAAVGAFLVTGALIIVAGFWKLLGRWVAMIPTAIASAMLAGVLMGLCLAPVKAAATAPEAALPVILVWAIVARLKRLWAVPAAVLVAVIVVMMHGDAIPITSVWPQPELIVPIFTLGALIGIALPLFIVTMASQNIPGIGVLRSFGYEPPPGRPIAVTGIISMLFAPFGGHTTNLSAIVVALCAGPDAHADPSKRYWAAISKGGC